jgi:hypothetical protein
MIKGKISNFKSDWLLEQHAVSWRVELLKYRFVIYHLTSDWFAPSGTEANAETEIEKLYNLLPSECVTLECLPGNEFICFDDHPDIYALLALMITPAD